MHRFSQPAPGDTQPLDHAQRWLAHVEQGRIGNGSRRDAVLLEGGSQCQPTPDPSRKR